MKGPSCPEEIKRLPSSHRRNFHFDPSGCSPLNHAERGKSRVRVPFAEGAALDKTIWQLQESILLKHLHCQFGKGNLTKEFDCREKGRNAFSPWPCPCHGCNYAR